MSDIHQEQGDLILLYYGEHPDRAAVDSHLNACGPCMREFRAIESLLDQATADPLPHPPGLEQRVWRAFAPEVRCGRKRRMPVLAGWVAAAAAIAGVSFYLGRQTAPQPDLRTQALAAAMEPHLERARVVLTEVANGGDLDEQRSYAADLLGDNRLYRQTAALAGHSAYEHLLDDLERILLEIAHAPKAESDTLRKHLEDDALLFRLRALEFKENSLL